MRFYLMIAAISLSATATFSAQRALACEQWLLPKVEPEHTPTFLVGAKPQFETKNLILRNFDPKMDRKSDIDQWINDDAIQKNLKFPKPPKEFRRIYKGFMRELERGVWLFPHYPEIMVLTLVVIEKASGRIIGTLSVSEQNYWQFGEQKFSMVEVGYLISPEARGHGYALEAATVVTEQIKAHYPPRYIYGSTKVNNEASIKTLERLGMQFWHHGLGVDDVVFSMGGP